MKRRSRFFIALATALLTFGTLRATLGPAKHHRHFGHHYGAENCREQKTEKPGAHF